MQWLGALLVVLALAVLLLYGRPPKKEAPKRAEAAPPLPPPTPELPLKSEPPPPPPPPPARKSHASIPPDDGDDMTMVGKIDLATLDAAKRSDRPTAPPPPVPDEVEVELEGPPESERTGPQALILVTGVAHTDTGRVRKGNEDSFLSLPEHSLFVVADGMGGYAGGALASSTTCATIEAAFRASKFEGEPHAVRPKRGDELVRSIEMANRAVFARASKDPELAGMGTTVVAVRFAPNKRRAYVAHVGDSRCYRLRNGKMEQITRDHTIGAVTGATGRLAAQLTRAVGIADAVDVDLFADDPEIGDTYLICSDGLTKMVAEDEIHRIADGGDLGAAAQALVDAANARGGRDNVTVILARVAGPLGEVSQKSAKTAELTPRP